MLVDLARLSHCPHFGPKVGWHLCAQCLGLVGLVLTK